MIIAVLSLRPQRLNNVMHQQLNAPSCQWAAAQKLCKKCADLGKNVEGDFINMSDLAVDENYPNLQK